MAPNTRGPASLPSGLGAGGRGKDKAPCRYLHYEVDWDEGDGKGIRHVDGRRKNKVHKLGFGLGPAGRPTKTVCISSGSFSLGCIKLYTAPSSMD